MPMGFRCPGSYPIVDPNEVLCNEYGIIPIRQTSNQLALDG